jgi:NADPH-dependent F420 reductase
MNETITIAIVGGTGSLGTGLAARLAQPGVKVLIGSRDRERAAQAAAALNRSLGRETIEGRLNDDAVNEADLAVIAVPYEGHSAMVADLAPRLREKLVVDAVVPLRKGRPFVPPAGSALQEAQQILGAGTPVVGALHNISALDLQEPDAPLGDVLVCGDSETAKQQVIDLMGRIGARAFDAGPAANAYVVEGITGVLIQLNRKYKSKHATLKITGI